MKIERKKISELKPAEYNPRKDLQPGEPEYEKLKKSIMEFGDVGLILVNGRSNTVIGGHQRLKIHQELGKKEVQVGIVDLPEDKEKALNLALNKISGEWDKYALSSILRELESSAELLELTGFDVGEIDELLPETSPVFAIDELLQELDMKNAVEYPIWVTIRADDKYLSQIETALKPLQNETEARIERSYAKDLEKD